MQWRATCTRCWLMWNCVSETKIVRLTGQCCLHLTGIAWQKKLHHKCFRNLNVYCTFYKLLVMATRCSSVALSNVLQHKMIAWLQARGEPKAADWFREYWTCDRGNWTLAHGGGTGRWWRGRFDNSDWQGNAYIFMHLTEFKTLTQVMQGRRDDSDDDEAPFGSTPVLSSAPAGILGPDAHA